ncbi:MAG: glutamate synthase subunit beta, partial [Lachnospiraceae bacterium]|nr:glutamate synthase subunit beta [Lachnospiraceae bacterium]
AFKEGLVKEEVPQVRTGKKVAVVGSGPSGLAAAQLLNRRGHEVTVYERSDRAGGLLRYGIPNMKLDKKIIDRRIRLMEEAGINFVYNANVGKNVDASGLTEEYDSVILACGASNPRDINAPGRDAKGIYFAVDFLSKVTKSLLDSDFNKYPYELAKDKDVIVIGGGDTGNDCVGTCMRLGAKSVLQLEMMPKPSEKRLPSNPWPEWPKVLKVDYGQQEAAWKFGEDPRVYQTTVKEFIKDDRGNLKEVVLVSLEPKKDKKSGRIIMAEKVGTERTVPAQLVLISAGFLGSEKYVTDSFKVDTDQRTNVRTNPDEYATSVENIYVTGDMHRGQSLVVWAIAEGRAVAKEVDRKLMGYTNL